jgi:hypothetical protein
MKKDVKIEVASKIPKDKEEFLKTVSYKELIQASSLFLDLSKGLLDKIDIYLCNTDLTTKQKQQLLELMEDVYGEGYVNSMSD